MPDKEPEVGERTRVRIDLGDEREVAAWAEALCVTNDELRSAVQRVGNVAEDVKKSIEASRI